MRYGVNRVSGVLGMAAEDDAHRYAAECLALAQQTTDPNDKARLLQMAQAWRDLAQKRASLSKKD